MAAQSEFYELIVTNTTPVSLDLSGACEVAFTVQGDGIYVARDRSIPDGERFLIQDMQGDGAQLSNVAPFVIKSSDDRLWIQAALGTCRVFVWVVKY